VCVCVRACDRLSFGRGAAALSSKTLYVKLLAAVDRLLGQKDGSRCTQPVVQPFDTRAVVIRVFLYTSRLAVQVRCGV